MKNSIPKIICTADTHGHLIEDVPVCDYFCVVGDIFPDFSYNQNINVPSQAKWLVDHFVPWLYNIPAKYKVIVPGNHDFVCEALGSKDIRTAFSDDTNIHYLEHEAKKIGDFRFFGSPWTPWFYDWAYNFSKFDAVSGYPQAHEYWEKIPDDTQILLTHGPPSGIGDIAKDNRSCGCPMLKQKIYTLKQLKLHAFGHIHDPKGETSVLETGALIANVAYGYDFEKNKKIYAFDIDTNT